MNCLSTKPNITPISINDLVINWHITEACNYSCQFCFAKWKRHPNCTDLWKKPEASFKLISQIHHLFNRKQNCLSTKLKWSALRLNVVGGEPTLLGEKMITILSFAKSIGLKTSIITNGSNQEIVTRAAPYLNGLGISIDSHKDLTNCAIGRRDTKNRSQSHFDMIDLVKGVRGANPKIHVKINTVVNSYNQDENLTGVIEVIQPDRWKIMQVLGEVSDNLKISASQFTDYVERHQKLKEIISFEDNHAMTNSYIMIDPQGRFFQNQPSQSGYLYSQSILEIGAEKAFKQLTFKPEIFAQRYSTIATSGVGQ